MTDYPKLPPQLARIYGNNPLFFVTFCSHQRRKFLATNSVNAAFLEFATSAYAVCNMAVGRYVIMPDHLHLFVCGPDDFELGRWIGMLNQRLGKVVASSRAIAANLATGFLRSRLTKQRKLWAEMESRP